MKHLTPTEKALARLLRDATNTVSKLTAYFSVEHPKRGKIARQSIKKLEHTCHDARRFLPTKI